MVLDGTFYKAYEITNVKECLNFLSNLFNKINRRSSEVKHGYTSQKNNKNELIILLT